MSFMDIILEMPRMCTFVYLHDNSKSYKPILIKLSENFDNGTKPRLFSFDGDLDIRIFSL